MCVCVCVWGGGGGGGHLLKKLPFAYFVNMEHFCHTNTYHLKVCNTFSKFNHTKYQIIDPDDNFLFEGNLFQVPVS